MWYFLLRITLFMTLATVDFPSEREDSGGPVPWVGENGREWSELGMFLFRQE